MVQDLHDHAELIARQQPFAGLGRFLDAKRSRGRATEKPHVRVGVAKARKHAGVRSRTREEHGIEQRLAHGHVPGTVDERGVERRNRQCANDRDGRFLEEVLVDRAFGFDVTTNQDGSQTRVNGARLGRGKSLPSPAAVQA